MRKADEEEETLQRIKIELQTIAQHAAQAASDADNAHWKAQLNRGRLRYFLFSNGFDIPIEEETTIKDNESTIIIQGGMSFIFMFPSQLLIF